jgi:aspartyl-tRNA(Asn)/glutamyl-tRNA(Gln) amidotransferase subunit C
MEYMQIEDKDVLHIAKLARLKLADNELENYKKNLQEILDFADTINHVNTDDIGETIGINENYNVFRKDEIKQESNKDELLSNAPSQDEGMFRIPKVIN